MNSTLAKNKPRPQNFRSFNMANQISDILSQMEQVNGCKVIDKSYIESERMFTLKLEGQKLIATITEDLVKSLHAMSGDEQNHFVTGKSLPKLLFLHQLSHNMTKDCSLNYEFST